MLFNSTLFICFFLITFGIYYLPILRSQQVIFLIIASTIFYAWSAPWLLVLLLISVLINAISSYWIFINYLSRPRLWAIVGVIANLLVLVFFKYNKLIGTSLSLTPQNTEGLLQAFILLPLPIGISFYTFQGISLVVDTYTAKKNNFNIFDHSSSFYSHLLNTTFFKTFFPQLISGPIVQAHDFYPQIKIKFFNQIRWNIACRQLILGYFLKMVVADNLKDQTFLITYPFFESRSSLDLIVLLTGYSFQIFSDFAGYSLIALGLSELLGYQLMQNFNFPYLSKTFSEFWTRWHISLSSFLRRYLYIPLGGNKKGNKRTYLNLFIVMFLGGLWHGAAWSYAIWGSFHGILLALERFFTRSKDTSPRSGFSIFLKTIFIFSCVTLGWLFFRLPNFHEAIAYLRAILLNYRIPPFVGVIFITSIFCVPPIIMHLNAVFHWSRKKWVEDWAYAIMLFLILTNAGTSGTFVYFQF